MQTGHLGNASQSIYLCIRLALHGLQGSRTRGALPLPPFLSPQIAVDTWLPVGRATRTRARAGRPISLDSFTTG